MNNWKQLTTNFVTGVPRRVAIPMGQYRELGNGEVVNARYIGFIQNSVSDKHLGRSSWSNFRIYEEDLMDLEVSIFDEHVNIPNVQFPLSNSFKQDSRDHILSIDSTSVTAIGNNWKFMKLNYSITVTPATMLKFKFALTEMSEFHFICLLAPGIDHINDGRDDCYLLAGQQSDKDKQFKDVRPTERLQNGDITEFNINIGSYFSGDVASIGFGLDNDDAATDSVNYVTDERISGQATWSDIKIYELPSLLFKLDGMDFQVPNHQISYKSYAEDNRPIRDFLIDVDATGLTATMKGNMWRAFELPEPLSIHNLGDFVVSFDFTLMEAGEIHGFCFEENLIYANTDKPGQLGSDSKRCLTTAYFQDLGDVPDIIPTLYQTRVGERHRYVLNLKKILARMYSDENAERPHNKNLAKIGRDGVLNECQGNCNSDADCEGSLRCFQRDNDVKFVPGCDGVGSGRDDYCYDPSYYTREFFVRYIVFISDDDRKDAKGIRSRGESMFSNIGITTNLTSCLRNEPEFSFSLADCTTDNFLAAIKKKMESTDACTMNNQRDPLLELFAMFDATEEMDVYGNIEKICMGAYKFDLYDVYDNTLGMNFDTERQVTREFLDGGSVWNYGNGDAGAGIDTATIEFVGSSVATSRLLKWPDHHALEHCDVGAVMCCTASSREFSQINPNSEICYVDIAASKRSAHVRDGYSIYSQDQTNDIYCEAFAWGTNGGSIQSALKGNALFQAAFANMLNGSVEQIPGAPLCGCLDRMPVVTNTKCTQVTSTDSTVDVTFVNSLGVFGSTFNLGTITNTDCGDFVSHYKDLEGGVDTPESTFVADRIVGSAGCTNATATFLATKKLGYKVETELTGNQS